jgi:predicted RNase H-like nuclease (RuvC/YqgF family)
VSHAVTTARRNLDYAKATDREVRRLRREIEKLDTALLAAKTAAAALRDDNTALRAQLARGPLEAAS